MAGDWIPMRANLEDDPTVVFIARATKLKPDYVVGKLHRLWSWVDANATDGRLSGIDAAWIDHYVRKRGFANAMASAPHPWLKIESKGVRIPNFFHWFGSSAKKRLTNTKRQQSLRKRKSGATEGATNGATDARTQQSTGQKSILAPALGGADWKEITTRARQVTEKLGSCLTSRNRRLLLGACALAANGMGDTWLETAVRETKDSHPEKPYAYLQTILIRTAEAAGVDFRGSIAGLDFPVAERPASVSEAPSC